MAVSCKVGQPQFSSWAQGNTSAPPPLGQTLPMAHRGPHSVSAALVAGLYPQADVLRDCQQMLLVPYQADSSSKGIWHPGESCRHREDTVQDGHSSQGLLSPLTSTGPALEVFPMAIQFLTCPQLSQRVKSHIQATYLSCSLPLITSVLLSMFSLPHLDTLAPWK